MTWIPLRRVCRMAYGDALPSDVRRDGEVSVIGSGGVSGSHVRPNTLGPAVIVGRKGSYGSIHWSDRPAHVIDTAYYIDSRHSEADLRWLYYALQLANLTGVTQDVGVPGLSRAHAYASVIPSPPSRDEQRRIADFLDAEISRLDRLIAARDEMLSIARERFASELTSRLLGMGSWTGSNGVWPTMALRRVVASIKTGSTPSENVYVDDDSKGTLPWYGPSSFGDGPVLGAPVRRLDPRAGRATVLPSNSTLVVGIGATAGKVAHLDRTASANQQITAIRAGDGIRPAFLTWQLWSRQEEMRGLAPFTTLPIINNDFLKSFPVVVPDLHAQDQIVSEADRSWSWLEKLQSATRRARDLLDERRRALITAAVTGQIDATTAQDVANRARGSSSLRWNGAGKGSDCE